MSTHNTPAGDKNTPAYDDDDEDETANNTTQQQLGDADVDDREAAAAEARDLIADDDAGDRDSVVVDDEVCACDTLSARGPPCWTCYRRRVEAETDEDDDMDHTDTDKTPMTDGGTDLTIDPPRDRFGRALAERLKTGTRVRVGCIAANAGTITGRDDLIDAIADAWDAESRRQWADTRAADDAAAGDKVAWTDHDDKGLTAALRRAVGAEVWSDISGPDQRRLRYAGRRAAQLVLTDDCEAITAEYGGRVIERATLERETSMSALEQEIVADGGELTDEDDDDEAGDGDDDLIGAVEELRETVATADDIIDAVPVLDGLLAEAVDRGGMPQVYRRKMIVELEHTADGWAVESKAWVETDTQLIEPEQADVTVTIAPITEPEDARQRLTHQIRRRHRELKRQRSVALAAQKRQQKREVRHE